MKITISDCAVERLTGIAGDADGGYFKLVYDTEGCGCGVDGTAALHIAVEKGKTDEVIQSGSFTFLVSRHDIIYFEERMTVDCRAGGQGLLLKSPERVISPNLNLPLQKKADERKGGIPGAETKKQQK